MLKLRVVLVIAAGAAGTFACADDPSPPRATAEQRLEAVAGPACEHAVCAAGAKLVAACDPCATQLCAADPYCCSTEWDATCVGEVASICGQSCTPKPAASDAGPSTCAHPTCATGGALASGCDACATALCAQDPYCCAVAWDATCVSEVTSICGQSCN
jgi:hypothetical protein